MTKKLTPKQFVLQQKPDAFAHIWKCGTVCIMRPFLGGNITLGTGMGYQKAWASAAKNLSTKQEDR